MQSIKKTFIFVPYMGVIDFLRRKQNITVIENSSDEYSTEKVGSLSIPDTLKDNNAFRLANTVAEIYFPIDFLADRASKLRFYIADKKGEEVQNTELNRFITTINPLYSFSELVYQALFSYLADGNIVQYVTVPDSYRNVSVNNIGRMDVLNPELLSIREYNNLSELTATNVTDFIKDARYTSLTSERYDQLRVDRLRIFRYDNIRRMDSSVLSRSPLFKSFRSINNLLATYSARYNVYANNGAAGYLVKKTSAAIDASLANRKDILNELNAKNGITGTRNLWGISSVPLEWINTLATIKDLMPFEETLEDSIKIAGAFGIPSVLIPRKDQSTFDNMDTAERAVWENNLISLVDTVLDYFSRSLMLSTAGYKIMADYSTVSVLKTNEVQIEDIISKKIQNLKALMEIAPAANIDNEITKILQSYEGR